MDSSPNGDLFPFIYLHLLHRLQGPGGQQVAPSKKEADEFSKVPFKDSLDRIHGNRDSRAPQGRSKQAQASDGKGKEQSAQFGKSGLKESVTRRGRH